MSKVYDASCFAYSCICLALMMQGSMACVFSATPALNNIVLYSRLCRRTMTDKLGIMKGSQRIDVCDYCYRFDHTVSPQFFVLNEPDKLFIGLDPNFGRSSI